MLKVLRNNLVPVLIAIGVHVVLIVMLFISFDWSSKPALVQDQPNVVKATVVDAGKVKAELDKLRRAEEKKQTQEQARIDKLRREERETKQRRAAEERRIAELKEKRATEEKYRQQEQQRLTKIKQEQAALEKKREAEQQRLTELEQQRKVEQERQRQAEAKRKAAEAKRKAAEDERKAIEAKRQAAEIKRRADERKQQLAEQLAAEEQANAEAVSQNEINKYQALIRQKVTRNWLKPAGADKGLACTVRVHVIPGGEVVGVTIIKGSGNAVFDRSVESAVRKASPLPLPSDPAVAARMREIDFEFIPEA
ncbi:cell envelope integrity protein TolA [Sulfuriflexus mobilis]|uniref:cell envelope integrity protein TolA n=1 Tax=Sulfuriflexus mobilis TaxID=1811807 RepID=UPI000F83D6D1|nr:cell envelope integrity protein TolA [Sulfuriflexus mobilis]